jgi:16S rRNA A1518/A1519 N6-dimethyltransferase RsmA/KsgA/DIM1 with predicted DNA glycosylase/AP lyase activity
MAVDPPPSNRVEEEPAVQSREVLLKLHTTMESSVNAVATLGDAVALCKSARRKKRLSTALKAYFLASERLYAELHSEATSIIEGLDTVS